jgi:hypothetical protein
MLIRFSTSAPGLAGLRFGYSCVADADSFNPAEVAEWLAAGDAQVVEPAERQATITPAEKAIAGRRVR